MIKAMMVNITNATMISSNVKPLIKMEYIKVLAQAQQLSKMLLLLLLFTVINGVLLFVNLIMTYYFGRK